MRILRGLGSQLLSCGCLAGRYETYDARIVTLIDAVGARCIERLHRVNAPVGEPDAVSVGSGPAVASGDE